MPSACGQSRNMTSMPMIISPTRFGVALCALFALAACSETFQPFAALGARAGHEGGAAPMGATRLIERDVEAPEIFEVTEEGLWDGRPSLGGVWVAHPTATDPERVIIRNEENGRFVIGALFRRERNNPGPELMVSSDAAAALNILAGDPTALQVTALRREEVADPVIAPSPEAEATLAAATDADTATPAFTATALDDPMTTIAAAAIAQSEAERAPPRAAIAAPAPVTAGSALQRPFVQIGIFSVEENANNTGQALRTAGLIPTIYDQTSNGRRFWRVVVGPASTADERDAILASVRGLGFADAYFVTR